MSYFKVTDENQIIIPEKMRQKLNIRPGDRIVFDIVLGDSILMRKVSDIDNEYLQAASETFAEEWGSPEDEEAYRDL